MHSDAPFDHNNAKYEKNNFCFVESLPVWRFDTQIKPQKQENSSCIHFVRQNNTSQKVTFATPQLNAGCLRYIYNTIIFFIGNICFLTCFDILYNI